MKVKLTGVAVEVFTKRMFKLLYDASTVQGMGILQARRDVPEEAVWQNVLTAADYGGLSDRNSQAPYADYCFGRMMKFGCKIDTVENIIELHNRTYSPDYQSWCKKYPDNLAILNATKESLVGFPMTMDVLTTARAT